MTTGLLLADSGRRKKRAHLIARLAKRSSNQLNKFITTVQQHLVATATLFRCAVGIKCSAMELPVDRYLSKCLQ